MRSGYVVADDGSLEIMAGVKVKTRQDRLKAALRENLKRRKAQARGRDTAGRDRLAEDEAPGASKERAE